MLHHAIGLFLEATLQIPLDKSKTVPQGKLVAGEHPDFYRRHLDIGGTTTGHKRPSQVVESNPEDIDSGREAMTEPSSSNSPGEDSDSAKKNVVKFT